MARHDQKPAGTPTSPRIAAAGAARLAVLLPALGLLPGCGNDTELKRQHSAPVVEIQAPVEADLFRQGAGLVGLVATVSDAFDAPEDLDVTLAVGDAEPLPLSAAADGTVSTDVSIDTLALGPLVLVVSATDTDGDVGSDMVTIDLGGPLGAPTVAITTPEDGYSCTLGDAVAFRGEASDTTTAADDLVFTWNSSLDGDIPGAVSADGASALFAGTLTAGTHTITLTATDADGESGSDSITVLVEEEVVVAEPGDLVFSELMINPEAVDDEVGEWVELYNTSGSPIDIAGYSFHDDDVDSWVLEGPLLVAANDYVVLCANADPTVNGGVPCDGTFFRDSTGNGLALANGPDEVVLSRPDATEIDWLHYDETWYLPAVATQLDPGYLEGGANDDVTHWCAAVTVGTGMTEPGTPGLVNDPCDPESP